ncbi:metallophosphoesterase family protein [Salipaludibacillus daqingensis]|uniref:metallophosphoesterase family protein n=1 Tax=Salipaludibacillus daqingensis TaxID=3041001 RepID=UPI0024767F16|nr:DNA repair exonuclease [Salipaludibacillus daqingensis]
MIRFMHCADLHLGRTFQTTADMNESFIKQAVEATYHSFEGIINEAISRKVDFVLISGDVYDQKKRSVRGQWFLKKQARKLLDASIPIFVIHGNHDPLTSVDTLIDMPENVYIFPKDVSHKIHKTSDGEKVVIYGFSYPQSAYTENPLPLYNKIESEESAYHIGLLHGQEKGQEGHDPYAPFTVKSLVEKEFDYWALGHVHHRQVLKRQPAIVYPGNIQGSHRKETGAKGAYYVELSHSSCDLTFIETSPIRWEQILLSITGLKKVDELIEKVQDMAEQLTQRTIIILTIEGNGILHEQLSHQKNGEELKTLIYEEMANENVWIDRIRIETKPELQKELWRKQDHLLGDVVRLREEMKTEQNEIEEILSPLYTHRKIRSYIDTLTKEEQQDIIDKAETMILTTLLEEGEGL